MSWIKDGKRWSDAADPGKGEFAGFFVILAQDDARLKRHNSEEAAVIEATRLAAANPGRRFVILESTTARIVDQPVRSEIPVFELPF
jgi:hypothetical protein